MRILLINPGGYRHEYPPLGMLYIAAVLQKDGHEVAYYDEGAHCLRTMSLMEVVRSFHPEVCGIGLYTTHLLKAFETISIIKSLLPGCKMVAGGPHATALPEMTLKECKAIDFVVCGEGEETAKELMGVIERRGNPAEVKGLYYRWGGEIRSTPKRALIRDLDSIPFPAYGLTEDFSYGFDVIKTGKRLATLVTSRVSPYERTFCAAKAVWDKGFRRRSPENVVREMAWLIENYGFDEFYFMDDLFVINPRWLEAFYRHRNRYRISAPWKCLGRVDVLSFEDYRRMAANGCYVIQFGVESGDDRILGNIKKQITTLQARKAFSEAGRAGLNTYGFFILGHRMDNYKTVLKTIYFAESLHPDFVSFFSLVPFPSTRLYELLPEALKYDWSRMMYGGWGRDLLPIKLSAVEPEDLAAFEQQAHHKIYGSLSYLMRNILFYRRRNKRVLYKCRLFAWHLLAKWKAILTAGWIFSRYRGLDLSDVMEGDAFAPIWRDWLRTMDTREEMASHAAERKRLFHFIGKYIRSSGASKVLEVGCGTALDTHYLSGTFPRVDFWATDISADAVDVARKAGKSLGSDAYIGVDNAERMSFPDNSFDLVFSQGLLEHFRNPLPALLEQKRILRPEGHLIVDVPQKYNPYTLYKRQKIRKGIWEFGWEREYSSGQLKRLGERAGLFIVDVGGYGYAYYEDYGFSLVPLGLRHLAGSGHSILSGPASFLLRLLAHIEKGLGHFFMKNIVVVFRKT